MPSTVPDEAGWVLDEYDAPRFWAHVNFSGGQQYLEDPLARLDASSGECWRWVGWNGDGYGLFRVWGRVVPAHRLAYRDFGNALDDALDIDHLCRVHGCVRPSHLEPVTHAENIRRGKPSRLAGSRGPA